MTYLKRSEGHAVEILLIEANHGDVRLVRELFADSGITNEIHVVYSGDEALDFIHQRDEYIDAPLPDIILLDLCQNQHRRIVLGTLTAQQRSLTLHDLTEVVLKYNHQTPITEASEDVLTKIRLSLYHVHLPKLASEGLINYDPERQLVEPTEQLDQVQPTLSTILDADSSIKTPLEL